MDNEHMSGPVKEYLPGNRAGALISPAASTSRHPTGADRGSSVVNA